MLCLRFWGKERFLVKGLIIVFTGEGKGKTSAALGVAFRAFGHKLRVSVIQFIKSSPSTGERRAAEQLGIELVSLGKGFMKDPANNLEMAKHRAAAEEAFAMARQRML